jgi:hypothetical protein
MELDKHFNLNIASYELYSKEEAILGEHGIEVINGEYYASHFHLKTKIATGKMKDYIEGISPNDLHALARQENKDFNDWPEVQYKADNYKIKKYKFSWLLDKLN